MYLRAMFLGLGCFMFILSSSTGNQKQLPPKEDPKDKVKKILPATEPPLSPVEDAERVLKDARIEQDGASLLQFMRDRTLREEFRTQINSRIEKLGDDSFDVREQATEDLKKAGLAALPLLRKALNNPDVELARRALDCFNSIDEPKELARISAVVTLLLHHKIEGAIPVILAYITSIIEDDVLTANLNDILLAHVKLTGKADPVLVAALDSPQPAVRLFMVRLLGDALPDQVQILKGKIRDVSPQVRFHAAAALARAGDKDSLKVLIHLLQDAPLELAFQCEDFLCLLLGEKETPPFSLHDHDIKNRSLIVASWENWLADKKDAIPYHQLRSAQRLLGLTLIMEVDGGNVQGGRIWECDRQGKMRWEITDLGGPVDVQILPGNRLLIPEFYNSRVTERDRKGRILWESPRLKGNAISAQRLRNGNTLIATMGQVMEMTPEKRISHEFPLQGHPVYHARRGRNGHTYILSGNSLFEYNSANALIHETKVGNLSGWAGFEFLPNGHFLIANYTHNASFKEIDRNGKVIWEMSSNGKATRTEATRIQYLPNGNYLVAGGNSTVVVEYDRKHNIVWKVATKGRPFGVLRY